MKLFTALKKNEWNLTEIQVYTTRSDENDKIINNFIVSILNEMYIKRRKEHLFNFKSFYVFKSESAGSLFSCVGCQQLMNCI